MTFGKVLGWLSFASAERRIMVQAEFGDVTSERDSKVEHRQLQHFAMPRLGLIRISDSKFIGRLAFRVRDHLPDRYLAAHR
jgi:hypothetical protein